MSTRRYLEIKWEFVIIITEQTGYLQYNETNHCDDSDVCRMHVQENTLIAPVASASVGYMPQNQFLLIACDLPVSFHQS